MPINIKLADNWRLKSDSQNIMLVTETNDREQIEGFYSTLEGAIDSFIKKKIRGCDATSLFGLLNYLKTLTTALNTALHPLDLKLVPVSDIKKQEQK